MRLLPAFAAAILFALAGEVAEAPFEIAAIAPLVVLGFAGLCWAGRDLTLTGAFAVLAPLAVATLPPGFRWLVVQALSVVLFLDVVMRLRRRLRDRETPTAAELFGLTLFLHVALAGRAFLPWQLTWTSGAGLLLPPVAAAFALGRIVRRRGFDTGLALAAILAALGSGWSAAGLLPLVALAAADEIAHAGTTSSPNLRRTLAVVVLLAPCTIETRLGLLAAVAGLAAALPHLVWRLAAPLGTLLAAIAFRLRGPNEALPQLLGLAAVAPSALLVARRDLGLVLPAVFVGAAGLLAGPVGEGGSVAPGALLATLGPAAMLALAAPRSPHGKTLQRVWALALVALATLTAGFPWLARSPLERAAGLNRAAVESMLDLVRGAPGWRSVSASREDLSGNPLRISLPVGVRRVAIVSQLANSAQLPRGTTVGRLRLSSGGHHTIYPLRSGIETGEWAARRPELRELPGSQAPEPWRSFVAPPSAARGTEIGQIYRTEFAVPESAATTDLEILRSAQLPSEALFEVRGVEWH